MIAGDCEETQLNYEQETIRMKKETKELLRVLGVAFLLMMAVPLVYRVVIHFWPPEEKPRRTISQFFEERGLQEQIEKYGMHPFELNVLDMCRTICEKTVSLLRYSFTANPVVGLRKKIRHFYDLHFLLRTIEGKEYLHGDFIRHLQELIRHDQAMFEEPEGWNTAPAISAPLLNNFDKLWQELSSTYEHELGMLAYKPIPPANEIKASMSGFIDFLKSNIE